MQQQCKVHSTLRYITAGKSLECRLDLISTVDEIESQGMHLSTPNSLSLGETKSKRTSVQPSNLEEPNARRLADGKQILTVQYPINTCCTTPLVAQRSCFLATLFLWQKLRAKKKLTQVASNDYTLAVSHSSLSVDGFLQLD